MLHQLPFPNASKIVLVLVVHTVCHSVATSSSAQETPNLVGVHATLLALEKSSGSIFSTASSATWSRTTQMAWGPGPNAAKEYLYVASDEHGLRRLEYDAVSGTLSSLVSLLPSVTGNGVAFHVDAQGHWEMYLSEEHVSANAPTVRLSRLRRYVDLDDDGVFDGAGDEGAVIAFGIPRGAGHSLNQIQFLGDSLYVGNGVRTQNGAIEGSALGESAYGGAILVIDDVTLVPTSSGAAGFAAYVSDPTVTELQDLLNGAAAGAAEPYTAASADKLRVHSSGTRNPFGLAIDRFSQIWFTNNFHRVNNAAYDRLIVDGTADTDAFDGPSDDDVHDQLFVAVAHGDYGYRNGNWQSNATAQTAGFFSAVSDPTPASQAHMFDNLDLDGGSGPDLDSSNPVFNQLHDPAQPVGLGPHAAVTGLDFGSPDWPGRYRDQLFIARFNGRGTLIDGLVYRDIILVDRATGDADRVVEQLASPTDILVDSQGNLLIASYFGSIWRLSPAAVPAPSLSAATRVLLIALFVGAAWVTRAFTTRRTRRSRRSSRPA